MARKRGQPLDGVLLLDKPVGLSSNHALQRAKRTLDAAKAGHTGTLDPFATGLLVCCMLEIPLTFEDGTRQMQTAVPPVSIGRAPQCAVRIANWRVGRQHARLLRQDGGIVLEDLGTLGGTLVNGERVATHGPLQAQDRILIGPCQLQVRDLPDPTQALAATDGSEVLPHTEPAPAPAQAPAALVWLPYRRSLHGKKRR